MRGRGARLARRTVLVLALGLSARAAAGSDATVDAAADRVERAAASGDLAVVRAAATAAQPDPWLVADALLARDAVSAAKTLADARSGPDAAAMRALVARGDAPSRPARERLAAAADRLEAGSPDDAVAALADAQALPDSVVRVLSLDLRARAHGAAKRTEAAHADLALAAEAATRLGWLDAAARLWSRAGDALQRANDLRGATRAWTRLAETHRARGDVEKEARAVADLGVLAEMLGDDRAAVAHHERALAGLPPTAPAATREAIRVRLGRALVHLGDYGRAHHELTAVVAALPTDAGARLEGEASSALGGLFRRIGDLEEARRWFDRSLAAYSRPELVEKGGARARRDVARAEANLAVLAAEAGAHDRAEGAFARVRKALAEADDPRGAARALQGLAEARLRTGRPEEARSLAADAAAESRAAGDVPGALLADATRAEAEAALGRRDEAERLDEAILAEADALGHGPMALEVSGRSARARLERGDLAGAMARADEGFRRLADLYGGLAERDRRDARSRHGDLFGVALRAAALAGDDAAFFRFLEAGRAGSLLDAIGNRDALRGRHVAPALEAERAEAERATVDAQTLVEEAGSDRTRLQAAKAALTAARGRYQRAVRAIQRGSRHGAHLIYPQLLELEEVAARLAGNEAVVAYAAVGDEATAFLVTRAGGRRLPLGPLAEARAAGEAARRMAAGAGGAGGLRAARARLWDPVASALPRAVRRIHVSPDGDLGLLPFPAFEDGDPNAPRRTFAFVPSATTLALLRDEARAAGATRGERVLAVGIARYARGERAGFLGAGRLPDLPRAEGEARAVGDVALLGDQATEDAFFAALARGPRWRAVHFAVHGASDRREPALSWLALAPSHAQDGYLTALEVLQRDVPADLAFLAACESGGGVPVRGEGLVGLVHAFLFAGCPRVVGSLWPASDAASSAFSTELHARWKRGAPLAEALEAARAKVRADPRWRDPSFWAGWCVWGLDS